MFLFPKTSTPLGSAPSILFNIYRGSFQGLKQLGREVNHWHPSSAEVLECSCSSAPPTCLHNVDRESCFVCLPCIKFVRTQALQWVCTTWVTLLALCKHVCVWILNTLAKTYLVCFAVSYTYTVIELDTSYMSVLIGYWRCTVHIVFVGLNYRIWLHVHPGLVLCLFGLIASCQFTQLLNLCCQFMYANLKILSFTSVLISVRQ